MQEEENKTITEISPETTQSSVVQMERTELKHKDGTPIWMIYEILPNGTKKRLGLQ